MNDQAKIKGEMAEDKKTGEDKTEDRASFESGFCGEIMVVSSAGKAVKRPVGKIFKRRPQSATHLDSLSPLRSSSNSATCLFARLRRCNLSWTLAILTMVPPPNARSSPPRLMSWG